MFRQIIALACAALPLSALAAVESYTIDPVHSFPIFTVEHLGLSNFYGRVNKTAGKVTIDRAARTASLDVSMDAASIDTADNDKGSRPRSRDEHLRSADFFNAAEFPKIFYKSTKVNFTGDTPSSIEGNLTMLGVTRPLTLTVERFKCNLNVPNRKDRCGGNATGKIKRSDFGMKYGIPSIGDEITLMLQWEGDRDAAP